MALDIDKKILVAGLTKNSEKNIKKDIERIYFSLKKYSELQWLIIESDSNDNTLRVLDELCGQYKGFRYISFGDLKNRFPLRTERLAFCRNAYLNELKINSIYKDVDFVAVADLDGINTVISESAIDSCWESDIWDVCAANQSGPYYDIWALRHKDWSPNDCWNQCHFLEKHGLTSKESFFAAIRARMIKIDESHPWIQVDSAFGGFAIYKRKVLEDAEYIGLTEDGKETCEHVALHEKIRSKGYKIFINPKLINAEYTNHTEGLRKKTLVEKINKKIKKIFKKY